MGLQGYQTFYSQFRQRFHDTGAIAPSSAALARAITAPLRQAAGTHLRVLEIGAGTGVFTRAVVAALASGDALDIYEINPVFEPFLRQRVAAAAPGVSCRLVMDDLMQQPPQGEYDFVISGLPLNNFSPDQVRAILDVLFAALRPGGTLSYFEYIALRGIKQRFLASGAEQARLRAVAAVVESFLGVHPSRAVPVMLNLPPAWARHVRA